MEIVQNQNNMLMQHQDNEMQIQENGKDTNKYLYNTEEMKELEGTSADQNIFTKNIKEVRS